MGSILDKAVVSFMREAPKRPDNPLFAPMVNRKKKDSGASDSAAAAEKMGLEKKPGFALYGPPESDQATHKWRDGEMKPLADEPTAGPDDVPDKPSRGGEDGTDQGEPPAAAAGLAFPNDPMWQAAQAAGGGEPQQPEQPKSGPPPAPASLKSNVKSMIGGLMKKIGPKMGNTGQVAATQAVKGVVDAIQNGDVDALNKLVDDLGLYRAENSKGEWVYSDGSAYMPKTIFGNSETSRWIRQGMDALGIQMRNREDVTGRKARTMSLEPDRVYEALEDPPGITPVVDGKGITIGTNRYSTLNARAVIERMPQIQDDARAKDRVHQKVDIYNVMVGSMKEMFDPDSGDFLGHAVSRGDSKPLLEALQNEFNQLGVSPERSASVMQHFQRLASLTGDKKAIYEQATSITAELMKTVDSKADEITWGRSAIAEHIAIIVSVQANDVTLIPPEGAKASDVIGIDMGIRTPDMSLVTTDIHEDLHVQRNLFRGATFESVKFETGAAAGAQFIVQTTLYSSLDMRQTMLDLSSTDQGSIYDDVWNGGPKQLERAYLRMGQIVQENQDILKEQALVDYGTDDLDTLSAWFHIGLEPPKLRRPGQKMPQPPRGKMNAIMTKKHCGHRKKAWGAYSYQQKMLEMLHNADARQMGIHLTRVSGAEGLTRTKRPKLKRLLFKNKTANCGPDAAFSMYQSA